VRLLLEHPGIDVAAVTSRSLGGKPLYSVHPHLRGLSDLRFGSPDEVGEVDVAFLCLPHGVSVGEIDRWRGAARTVVDLSSDFRLRSADLYREWYGSEHARPDLLSEAIYGLPELTRERLPDATLVSGVGCNATAMVLALLPLASAGVIDRAICDIKVGSSEAGRGPSAGSHHPERSGVVRSYAPAGHRHAAEVFQALGDFVLDVSVTAVELVRGAVCTAHVVPSRPVTKKDLWGMYREAYSREPFVRLVSERSGAHRLPDAKTVVGSNFADVGFEVDERTGRVVVISAIDNLVKGAAGSAVQAMNVAMGFEEMDGLGRAPLYPA